MGYNDHCTTINVIKFIELKKEYTMKKVSLISGAGNTGQLYVKE